MAISQSITVGSRVINLHLFQGEVMDEKKWTTTEISGGGGGGYVHSGSGYVSNAPIRSTTTTHDQVFLRSDDGQERAFKLTDAALAVRKGHRLSLAWGIPDGKDSGPFVAIYNHTTNDLKMFDNSITSLAFPVKPALLFIPMGIGALFVFSFTLQGIVVGLVLAGLGWKGFSMGQQRVADVRAIVDGVVAQLKDTNKPGRVGT